MRQLHGEVASSRRRPEGKVAKADQLPAAARSKRSKAGSPTASASTSSPTEEEEIISEKEKDLYNPSPQVQNPPGVKIPGFVYAIGMYFLFNYFFSS